MMKFSAESAEAHLPQIGRISYVVWLFINYMLINSHTI